MRNGRKTPRKDDFIAPARRALRRAAQNVKIQNRAFKLPVIVWQDGKVEEKPA